MRQEQITRTKSVPRMDEVAQQYEAEQHERQMRIARKAVKRARMIITEAEHFLSDN